jgi:hypothetical protein
MIMRLRHANIRLINRRSNLPRLLLALSSINGQCNDNSKNNPTDAQGLTGHSISVLWFRWSRGRLRVMAMVKYLANTPTCTFGDLACSLGGANADVLASNGRTLSDIAGGVEGVEGDEIARTFPDSLGCCTGALGGSFADVSCAAANVAAGAALLRLGGRLGCVGRLRRGLGLAALAAGVLAADGEG